MKHQNTIGLDDYEKILINPNHLKIVLENEDIFNFTEKEDIENNSIILFKKEYKANDAGFLLICMVDQVIEWNTFKDYYLKYSLIAEQRCNSNFREISFMLVAKDYTTEVREFCKVYNEMYDYRKPIKLFNLK